MLRPIPFCFFSVTVIISGSFLKGCAYQTRKGKEEKKLQSIHVHCQARKMTAQNSSSITKTASVVADLILNNVRYSIMKAEFLTFY